MTASCSPSARKRRRCAPRWPPTRSWRRRPAIRGRRSRRRSCSSTQLYLPYTFLEQGAGFNSRLFSYARTLVRAAAERGKDNTARLREYRDAALPRVQQRLLAPVPAYPALEKMTLSFSLERMREWLGPDAAIVRQLLVKDSPDTLAARAGRRQQARRPGGAQAAVGGRRGRGRCLARSDDRAGALGGCRRARGAQAVRGPGGGARGGRRREDRARPLQGATAPASRRMPTSRCA